MQEIDDPCIDEIFFEDFHETDVICVYGKSNPEYLSFLKNWLKEIENRSVIFLEDDLKKYDELLSIANKNFKEEKKAKTFLIKDFEIDLKKIAWQSVYLDLKIIKSPNEKRLKNFDKISKTLTNLHRGANLTSYLYSDFGIKTFENFYNNLIKTDEFLKLENLKNEFKDIPAIIVGAGPSLDKNLYHLKDLNEKAIVFAGGSALNILAKKNIKYHFSASIDPNPFFKRFKENEIFEKPFFYQNQIDHNNLSLVHGKKILISDYGAYPLKNWMYEKLNINQDILDGGWTVTTLLIKIAKILGCNPIITIGLDLSFKKQKYPKGVVKEKSVYAPIKTKDIFGNEVRTQKDWLFARDWIEEFASLNRDKTFINATEGGLKIENFKNLKLIDILNNLESTKKSQIDLDAYVHTKIANEKPITLDQNKVIELFSIISGSFKKSDLLLDEYISDLEKGEMDFNLLKLQKEVVYVHLLDPLWQIWKYTILRKIEDDKAHILLNKILFFKNVIFQHINLLGKIL